MVRYGALRRTTSAWILACLVALPLLTAAPTVVAGPFEDAKAAFERGDVAGAFKMFKPLAEEGDAGAQFWLGQMYDLGKGVPQNLAQASLWYRKAAEQGNVMAQHNLGHMYETGEGTRPSEYSLTAAASWYRRAAELDYKPSQANLGALYANGRGVRRDFVEGYMWMLLAGSIADTSRDALAKRMTPQQIASAERAAKEWKPKSDR